MTSLMLVTPAYSGMVHIPYVSSLCETYLEMALNRIEMRYRIHAGGSLLVAERNSLVREFLKTDCTHVLMVDSDLGWPPKAVKAMLDYDLDFVAGCYPTRDGNAFLFRPKLNANGSIVTHSKHAHLLEMEYVPAGFMLLKRNVLEKMLEDNPDLHFVPKNKEAEEGDALFNTEIWEGEFWGEDYVFCRRARKSGFKIYVDPGIEFDHAGQRASMAKILTNDPEKSLYASKERKVISDGIS